MGFFAFEIGLAVDDDWRGFRENERFGMLLYWRRGSDVIADSSDKETPPCCKGYEKALVALCCCCALSLLPQEDEGGEALSFPCPFIIMELPFPEPIFC